MINASEATKHTIDGLSLITVVGTLIEILPAIAALFTIVWTGIRIYETQTITQLFKRKKDDG